MTDEDRIEKLTLQIEALDRRRRKLLHERANLSRSVRQKGKTRSDETKARMSAALMGHPVSEEARQRMRDAAMGRKPSDDTRERMSLAQRARFARIKGVNVKDPIEMLIFGSGA